MRWLIGIDDGRITFEGGEPYKAFLVSARFQPGEIAECRAFFTEWEIGSETNAVIFRSSFNHPADNGLTEEFDSWAWMDTIVRG